MNQVVVKCMTWTWWKISRVKRSPPKSHAVCPMLLTWCLNAGAAANCTLRSSAWPGDPAYSRILSSSCSRRPTSFSSVAIRASLVSKMAVSVPLEATPTLCVWYAFSNSICSAFRLSLVAFRSCVVESQTKKQRFHKKRDLFQSSIPPHYFTPSKYL